MSSDPSKKDINDDHIILLFLNFDYSPEVITEKINLTPSRSGLKGEKYYLGHNHEVVKYRKCNFWEYELRQITNDFIGDSFDLFVEEVIYPRAASIRSVAETCDGELKWCSITIVDTTPVTICQQKSLPCSAGRG
jgi:uncharacterized protein DUF4279